MIKENPHDFIEPGTHDALIGIFIDTFCRYCKQGTVGLEGADQVRRYVEKRLYGDDAVVQLAGTCLCFLTGGRGGFCYHFLLELEYQRIFRTVEDDQTLVALHLVKTLSDLIRWKNGREDIQNLYYLAQRHCAPEAGEALMKKLVDTFNIS